DGKRIASVPGWRPVLAKRRPEVRSLGVAFKQRHLLIPREIEEHAWELRVSDWTVCAAAAVLPPGRCPECGMLSGPRVRERQQCRSRPLPQPPPAAESAQLFHFAADAHAQVVHTSNWPHLPPPTPRKS